MFGPEVVAPALGAAEAPLVRAAFERDAREVPLQHFLPDGNQTLRNQIHFV